MVNGLCGGLTGPGIRKGIGIARRAFPGVFLSLLIWFCVAARCLGANWYVDNAAIGLSTGTSWANAWPSFALVVWGSSGVKAGDTLYISGGSSSKRYTEMWSVGASGTASQPIRIAVDAANPSHNGYVIFDYDLLGDTGTGTAITCSRSYITFDGNVGGQCHLVISNLRNYLARTSGVGIRASGGSGVVIDHVASTNCNNPIYITSSGFRVSNCNIRQVRGDAAIASSSSGTWDANLIYSNVVELLWNTAVPPGKTSYYVGPDGIQCNSGLSIFGNTFIVSPTTQYTSDQHTDTIQAIGNYLKIYNNEFINAGDSVFDYDCYNNANPHDVWIYNNIFRITQTLDDYPEYFRMYASFNSIASINNFKILNNTFIDNNYQYRVIRFDTYNAVPTGAGNEIKNNIFYNCGGGNVGSPVIYIEDSAGWSTNSFTFDANIYYLPSGSPYISYRGTGYKASSWVAANEPKGKTNAVKFVNYAAFRGTNDLHLLSTDTAAKDGGLSFASYFTLDRDYVTRPQGSVWDIGAYEFVNTSGPAPSLKAQRTRTNSVVVSWPSPSTGWVLQQGTGMSGTNWTTVTVPISDDGTNRFIVVYPATGLKSYRLNKP